MAIAAGLPTGVGICVLAQQHGVVPASTGWMSSLSLGSVGLGAVAHMVSGKMSAPPSLETPIAMEAEIDAAPVPGGTPTEMASPADAAAVEAMPTEGAIPSRSGEAAPVDAPATAVEMAMAGGGIVGSVRGMEERDPPRSAFALVDCPSVAHVGQPIEVVIGLSPQPTPGVVGGEMHRPPTSVGSYVLTIDVVADGFELSSNEKWRNDLVVTADDPYPTVSLHVAASPQEVDVQPRSIQAIYAIEGQTIGLAVRPVAVLKDQSVVTNVSTGQPVPLDISIPTDQNPPDMTIRILVPSEEKEGLLRVSVDTPYGDVTKPEASFIVDIGQDAASYAARLVKQVGTREGQPGLYEFLLGTGKDIAAQLPSEFWSMFADIAKKVGDRNPTILILSQEPYIPWELAVADPVIDPKMPPFLAAQASVGRWILAERGPKLPPPTRLRVEKCAVICGAYVGPDGQRLLEAEEEGKLLQEAYAAAEVNADMREVLDCLKGTPPAEVLHFAVHGCYDPGQVDSGLALTDGTVLASEQIRSRTLGSAPLVFLNACQVGSGDETLGDYSGIAAAFLHAGASGVIAPLWSIRDALAKDIALRFYEGVFGGVPPAEVFRRERGVFQDLHETASATYLAYQFYGHPALMVERASS